jgi:hypothetical protein
VQDRASRARQELGGKNRLALCKGAAQRPASCTRASSERVLRESVVPGGVAAGSYQYPSHFHHANPTVSQMVRFTTETTKPVRHHSPKVT